MLIEHKERSGVIQGIKICPEALFVHHLFFADDNFVFSKATFDECQQVLSVLNLYESAFRQVVNLNKSLIVFSYNVREDVQLMLTETLGVKSA